MPKQLPARNAHRMKQGANLYSQREANGNGYIAYEKNDFENHQQTSLPTFVQDTHESPEADRTPPSRARKRVGKVTPSDTTSDSRIKGKGKQKKSLSLLPEMPLDILFEIFGHLPPKDVITLTRTFKILREILLSRNATTVWKAALSREDVPECPSWMTEPAWASLLFEPVCQSCGTKNVHTVDFHLVKRVCLTCKKRHLVNKRDIFQLYPDACKEISSLLPVTNASGSSHTRRSKSHYFWDSDVEGVVSGLRIPKEDLNAQKILDDFKSEQKQKVSLIEEKSGLWADWLVKYRQRHIVLEAFNTPWSGDDISFGWYFGQWFYDANRETDFGQLDWLNGPEVEWDSWQWFSNDDMKLDGLSAVDL